MSETEVVFTPANRFFDQLVTAQAATAAWIHMHMEQHGHNRGAFKAGEPIHQVGFSGIEITFEPVEVLDPITRMEWPSQIHLKISEGSTPPPSSTRLTPVQFIMGRIYESAFVAYFENNSDAMLSKYVTKSNFPDTLQFGRIVRNAFAHGGKVAIRNGISGSWRGLTYSERDNGTQVLYTGLSAADLTLLMRDMDVLF